MVFECGMKTKRKGHFLSRVTLKNLLHEGENREKTRRDAFSKRQSCRLEREPGLLPR